MDLGGGVQNSGADRTRMCSGQAVVGPGPGAAGLMEPGGIHSFNSDTFEVRPLCLARCWVLGSRNGTASGAQPSQGCLRGGRGSGHSPNPGKEAAEEESAIALDER